MLSNRVDNTGRSMLEARSTALGSLIREILIISVECVSCQCTHQVECNDKIIRNVVRSTGLIIGRVTREQKGKNRVSARE